MNISLVIYCQNPQSLPKIYELTSAYAPFFSQCIILLNLSQNTPIPPLYPPELKRVSILRMPDKIDDGAALNKFFPHLQCDRVLLIDSHAHIKKEIITVLRHWAEWDFERQSCIVSFQPIVRCSRLHFPHRQGIEWRKSFRFVTTMNWGAIFFDHKFVLGLGAFDAQLSEDALMVDLSWRAQQSTGLLVETMQPYAVLKESYEPTALEWIVLNQKHPRYYPTWLSFFKRMASKVFQSQTVLEQPLN